MRRMIWCGRKFGVRGVILAAVVLGGVVAGGCVRHKSQIESLRVDLPEIAPEKGGTMVAEIVE